MNRLLAEQLQSPRPVQRRNFNMKFFQIVWFVIGLLITQANAQTGQLQPGQFFGNPSSASGEQLPIPVQINQMLGTQNMVFGGTITDASLSTVGTIGGSLCATSSGLFLYKVGVNCFAAGSVTNLAPGTTTISPSTSGDILYDNAGVLGELSLSSNLRITAGSLDLATSISITQVNTSSIPATYSLKDAASTPDIGTLGLAQSVPCDLGYINGSPGSGPCYQIKIAPNSSTWSTLFLNATNARVVMGSYGGVENPELVCGDTNVFGVPVFGGGNQSGCGFIGQARINSNSPVVFDAVAGGAPQSTVTASLATGISGNGKLTVTAQSGALIVFGETFVGGGFTSFIITGSSTVGSGNCSPSCTGAGGTGTYATSLSTTISSETMIGGPSGAENSMSFNLWGSSLAGDTQTGLFIFSGTGTAIWSNSTGTASLAGMRGGEFSSTGMSGDGLFTETETASLNSYFEANCNGTHVDGSYQCPTNWVGRQAPNAVAPERIVWVFDYNGNLLLGANGSTNGFSATGNVISSSTTNSLVFYPAAGNPTNNPPGGALFVINTGGAPGLYYKGATGTVTKVAPN
jgi:hypothetical protein